MSLHKLWYCLSDGAFKALGVVLQEPDLMKIFEPFGHIDVVNLQKDATGRSQGYGFVQ